VLRDELEVDVLRQAWEEASVSCTPIPKEQKKANLHGNPDLHRVNGDGDEVLLDGFGDVGDDGLSVASVFNGGHVDVVHEKEERREDELVNCKLN